jgi:hypothetical protein
MYGAEVWKIPTREINKILSTEMDVLRRSTRKSRLERIKNEHIKEIMGVKEKPDIIDIIERKRLQWYGHVKRMQEERLPKLIMEWIPGERRKRGRPRKTWMEGVRAAMKTRHLEVDQWLNRKEWCLGSGRRRQLSQDRKDRYVYLNPTHVSSNSVLILRRTIVLIKLLVQLLCISDRPVCRSISSLLTCISDGH